MGNPKGEVVFVCVDYGKTLNPLRYDPRIPVLVFLHRILYYTPGMTTSPKILKFLALITWITGGMFLFLKGYALFIEANDLKPGIALNFLPFPSAVVVGSLKARYLFVPNCRRNLARIDALSDPKLWQFFRAGFFVLLLCMILLGAWMSSRASGNYGMLLAVSSMDLTLSVALLGSLYAFK